MGKIKVFILLYFIFILFFINVYSVEVEVGIVESSTFTKLLSSHYSLNANGVLSVYNPTNVSRIYEFNFPLELDALIGISLFDEIGIKLVNVTKSTNNYYNCSNCSNFNLSSFTCGGCLDCDTGFVNFSSCTNCTNTTLFNLSGFGCTNCSVNITYYNVTQNVSYSKSSKLKFEFDKISGYIINPGETVEIGYSIFGILNYNIYDKMNSSTRPVLDYYIESYDFISNVILNLDKPQREGAIYDINGILLNATPTSNTTRVVTAIVRNPTEFDLFFRNLKLYKTTVSDPFFSEGDVLNSYYNFSIEPFSYRSVDFSDMFANENNVYWLSSEAVINYKLNFNVTRNYKVDSLPSDAGSGGGIGGGGSGGGGSGGGIGGGGSSGGYYSDDDSLTFNSILIKKDVDNTIIKSGEEFRVYLNIVNINEFKIFNLSVFDEVPDNYEIKDIKGNVEVFNNDVIFFIEEIGAYDTVVLSYTLVLKEDFKGITYLKPAKLSYEDQYYFSQGVLLINDLLPTDKVFIQKEIKFIDDEFAKIIITVKNLGSYSLEDILISDDLSEDSIVKDISKMFFEKGIWRIKSLYPGEEWEVSYLIRRDGETFDSLPNLFGVDKSDVYGTLIFSDEIVTVFSDEPGAIEKVGLSIAVGFLVIYLLF